MATKPKPKLKRKRPVPRWTIAKRDAFLAELAQTANVAGALRSVGMSAGGVYLLKKRDPGFAAAWDQALAEGYAALELMMLRRALTTMNPDPGEGSAADAMSERTVLALIQHHRQTVAGVRAMRGAAVEALDEDEDTLRSRLAQKFAEIRTRLEDEA